MKLNYIIKIIAVNALILFSLLECVSYLYLKKVNPDIGYLRKLPTYLEFDMEDRFTRIHDPMAPHFIDTSYPWSTWHPRNAVFRHKKNCFDVLMKYNEEGTRGKLPAPNDSNTVFFLGDSFMEGYGLSEDSTIASLFSVMKEKPVLNLGCSGHIGTTQYSMIYKHFAKKYKHKKVIVSLFLGNDFMENDVRKYGHFFGQDKRYRPYRSDSTNLSKIEYKGTYRNSNYSWDAYHRLMLDSGKVLDKRGLKNHIKNGNSSVLSNLISLTYTKRLIYGLQKNDKNSYVNRINELYFDNVDLDILAYDLRDIMHTAELHGAEVIFFNIPGMKIVQQAKKDSDLDARYKGLESFIETVVNNNNHRFVSYYEYLKANNIDPRDLVFDCDEHYNSYGSYRLAKFICLNDKQN
jgi:hypothetical protein